MDGRVKPGHDDRDHFSGVDCSCSCASSITFNVPSLSLPLEEGMRRSVGSTGSGCGTEALCAV
jgi:hypothetical protein